MVIKHNFYLDSLKYNILIIVCNFVIKLMDHMKSLIKLISFKIFVLVEVQISNDF